MADYCFVSLSSFAGFNQRLLLPPRFLRACECTYKTRSMMYADSPSVDSVCNNLSVSILIDDKPVELYNIQVKDNNATCCIESVEGKEFKIRNKMIQAFHPRCVAFYGEVDGSK